MPITRTPIVDDDGSGMTGTVIDNSWKQELYNQIDGALVGTVAGPINLTSGQIQFPVTQLPSSNPNVLDDYEEGNWTPIISALGGATGQVHVVQVGRYVKIGRSVRFHGRAQLSTLGTFSGQVAISGLPFNSDAIGGYDLCGVQFHYWDGLAVAVSYLSGKVAPGAPHFAIHKVPAAGGIVTSPVVQADIAAGLRLDFSGEYLAGA